MFQDVHEIADKRKEILHLKSGPILPFIGPAIFSIILISLDKIFLHVPEPWTAIISLLSVTGVSISALVLRSRYRRDSGKQDGIEDLKRELEEKEDYLFISQQLAHIGTWEMKTGERILKISSGMRSLLRSGISDGTVPLDHFIDLIHPDDRNEFINTLNEVGRTGYAEFEQRLQFPGNETRTFLHRIREERDEDEHPVKISGTVQDITDAKAADNEIRKLTVALQNSQDWIVITDASGKAEYVNSTVEKISGYSEQEILAHGIGIWKSGIHNRDFYRVLWETLRRGDSFKGLFICRKKNAELFYLDQTIIPVKDEAGRLIHFIGAGKDVTQAKQMEERLNHLSYYDALTNLPNRRLFTERLRNAIRQAQTDHTAIAVLNLDINRFRLINDSFGSRIGDEILKTVAVRLSMNIRENDTAARIGNDEWGIVLTGIDHSRNVIQVIETALHEAGKPIAIHEEEVVLSLSAGIALYPDDGTNHMDLVRNSETALIQAKAEGKNSYKFFTTELNRRASEFIQMERDLSHAIENRELIVYYQPFYDLENSACRGMEALLRWKRRGGELISPSEFIPILEETGMIVDVGNEVIRMVAEQIGIWKRKGFPVLPVAINLSALQFRQNNLADSVETIIRTYGIDPSSISFEITESTFMQDLEYTKSTLMKLRNMGFQFSIDDFGTGYSSLSYLKRFPVNNLKIDKSFIADLPERGDDLSIVRAIISMAGSLNLKTTAEGVQDEESLTILKEEGCDYVQGFYFSPPVPPGTIEEMIFRRMNTFQTGSILPEDLIPSMPVGNDRRPPV